MIHEKQFKAQKGSFQNVIENNFPDLQTFFTYRLIYEYVDTNQH